MNKARKQRQRRKERDMRWVLNLQGFTFVSKDSHRGKKVFGLSKREDGKRPAFWCHETDTRPLISKIYHECVDSYLENAE